LIVFANASKVSFIARWQMLNYGKKGFKGFEGAEMYTSNSFILSH
jgi:hypothetical protein